jgi:hypothetical protein
VVAAGVNYVDLAGRLVLWFFGQGLGVHGVRRLRRVLSLRGRRHRQDAERSGVVRDIDDGMNKARFLDTMRSERERWEALLAEVGELRMERPGVAGDWSVRDVVVHVTAYERGLVEWLEAASRGESAEFPVLDHPDVEYRNAAILRENQGRPLEDVLLEAKQVFQRLLQLVRALSEEELTDPEHTEWFVKPRWKESRPIWKCIADDSYRHCQQHIPDIRAWLDQAEHRGMI